MVFPPLSDPPPCRWCRMVLFGLSCAVVVAAIVVLVS
jgi:hypothetical protein